MELNFPSDEVNEARRNEIARQLCPTSEMPAPSHRFFTAEELSKLQIALDRSDCSLPAKIQDKLVTEKGLLQIHQRLGHNVTKACMILKQSRVPNCIVNAYVRI